MRTGLSERVRWFVPALVAVVALGAPGVVAADGNVAPSVTATVSNANPVEPQTVVASATFTDPESDVETYTCTIDYGDGGLFAAGVVSGTTCTGPAHRYLVTGSYVVIVFVTDSGGAGGAGMTAVNFVNSAPYVVGLGLVGYHQVGRAGHAVTAVEDNGSDVETYACTSIDYGDGTPLQAGTWVPTGWSDGLPRCVFPDHFYAAIGDYRLTAVVTDSGGASGSASVIQTIVAQTPPDGPTVVIGNPQVLAEEGVPVTVLNGILDPAPDCPYTVHIDWGDGTSKDFSTCQVGPLDNLTHTYAAADPSSPPQGQPTYTVYTATMTATDTKDVAASGTWQVAVKDDAPVVMPNLGIVLTEGQPVTQITLATFTDPRWRPWQVYASDDGSIGRLLGAYTAPGPIQIGYAGSYGSKTLTVTVLDRGGQYTTVTVPIAVTNVAPVVSMPLDFYTFGPTGIDQAASVTFTDPGAASETYTCTIDYGDGAGPQSGVVGGNVCTGPHHTYTSKGTYAFVATVTDSNGGVGLRTLDIEVYNQSPIVGSISAPDVIDEGQTATAWAHFTPTGLDETYTCTIDYGEGQLLQEGAIDSDLDCLGQPSLEYTNAGTYVITITVMGSSGDLGSASRLITVANVAPVLQSAAFLDPVMVGSAISPAVTFYDPGYSGEETYACLVDYGDGVGPQTGVIEGNVCTGPGHTYASKGTYTFVATVTDSNGGVGTYTHPIEIYNPAPTVGLVSAPASAMVGTAVTASAAYVSTGLVPDDTCTVDYGDGTGPLAGTADGAICTGPSHNYASVGTFTITVTLLSDIGSTGSSSATIKVYSLSVGAVSVTGSLTEGSSVTASASFTPTGRQTYKCKVDYGDGTGAQTGTISGTTCKGPSHKYGRPGSFTLTVTVTGSKGNVGSSTRSVEIANVMPVVTATLPAAAKVGTSVTLSASFTDPGTNETYQVVVDWGDGTRVPIQLGRGRSFTASHTYTRAGGYQVVVEVSDDQMAHVATAASGIAVYDPARTLAGSGTFASPAGACTVSSKCAGASTATFSVTASYARGATKPTATFTFSAAGISFTATSFEWYMVTDGVGILYGSGKLNGLSGYRFTASAVDGTPDSIAVSIVDSNGNSIYYNNDYAPLKTGWIVMR